MSWSVLRGVPYPSQQYLDRALAEVGPGDPRHVTLPQILYHCLNKHTDDVLMINGTTGVKVSNGEMLKQAVLLARALRAQCASGTVVMLCMKNHEHALAVFFGTLFAGVVPFMVDPHTTVFELSNFMSLVSPQFVFCDEALVNTVNAAYTKSNIQENDSFRIVTADNDKELEKFTNGQENNVDQFHIPFVDPYSPALLIPTSGSTGAPKAAIMTHRGIIINLPLRWAPFTRFPRPTRCGMLLSTLQWISFTIHVATSVVFRVPILLSPEEKTEQHVKHLLATYKPSYAFFGPAFMKSLLLSITGEDVSSLETVVLGGAPSTVELLKQLKALLPPNCIVLDGYGTTEMQGYIALADLDAPPLSCGRVVNTIQYKLLDETGREVGLDAAGELYVKGDSLIKGYYKNPDAYSEAIVDGWYRTGDKFYIDTNERLHYIERVKFSFEYKGYEVSPEELESVILSIPGVMECCVCKTDRGPAAAIALTNIAVTRELVVQVINVSLSEPKRLDGGIAFVSSLPHTHSGKLQRLRAKELILHLQQTGECC